MGVKRHTGCNLIRDIYESSESNTDHRKLRSGVSPLTSFRVNQISYGQDNPESKSFDLRAIHTQRKALERLRRAEFLINKGERAKFLQTFNAKNFNPAYQTLGLNPTKFKAFY